MPGWFGTTSSQAAIHNSGLLQTQVDYFGYEALIVITLHLGCRSIVSSATWSQKKRRSMSGCGRSQVRPSLSWRSSLSCGKMRQRSSAPWSTAKTGEPAWRVVSAGTGYMVKLYGTICFVDLSQRHAWRSITAPRWGRSSAMTSPRSRTSCITPSLHHIFINWPNMLSVITFEVKKNIFISYRLLWSVARSLRISKATNWSWRDSNKSSNSSRTPSPTQIKIRMRPLCAAILCAFLLSPSPGIWSWLSK